MRTKAVSRSVGGNAAAFLFLLVLAGFIALPIYYSVINAFKPIGELFLFPPRFFVYRPTLSNFVDLLRAQTQSLVPAERYVFNSVFLTVVSTAVYVLIASMAAFPLAKHRFPGKQIVTRGIVFAILFRPEVTALPQYMLMAKLGILDTFLALLLPLLAGSFGVFLMMQFMSSLPDDILEAAQIDGAGEKYAFFRIVLPCVKPALLTLTIFTFVSSWATTGSTFIYSEQLKLLPTMIAQLGSAGLMNAGIAAAGTVVLMLPPILVFVFCQGSVIETMTYSGIKS